MLHIIIDVLQKVYPKHEGCITSVYFQNYSLYVGKVKKIYFITPKILIVRKRCNLGVNQILVLLAIPPPPSLLLMDSYKNELDILQ